jgi:dTDP-4-dehydrorhamnose reductase
MQTILVTGAGGLLGSAVTARLRAGGWAVLALGHSRPPSGGGRVCNLEDPAELAALDQLDWTGLVHCAAYRSPDFCESEPDRADRLNAGVPGELAVLAARRGARMIHISTDYVFPGTHPPYRESDPVHPVNRYGRTKVESERHVVSAHSGALILRIPALYGNPEPPLTAPLLEEGLQAACSVTRVEVDDRIVRYPTLTDDVAGVIAYFLDHPATGIVQVSADEVATRYRWTMAIARLLGRDGSNLVPVQRDLGRVAIRPVDCHLDTTRLAALGAPLPRGYSVVLPELLRIRRIRDESI